MNNYQTSTLLRKLRDDYNYTIQKVAGLLGVSKAAVSKWENGDDIATENLYNLSKLYNVTFTELYYGKLNNEDNNSFWQRNYDLSNYQIDEEINNKNVDKLKLFFEHCSMVKRRFYSLLPKWAYDELKEDEKEEFRFIKKYFKFDNEYYNYYKNGVSWLAFNDPVREKEIVKELIDNIKDLEKKSYFWELKKIYNFNYDIKEDLICKSRNLKALEYMLLSYSQIEKDLLLNVNFQIEEEKEETSPFGTRHKVKYSRQVKLEEIEKVPYFKVMINSGAKVLKRIGNPSSAFEAGLMDKINGKVVKLEVKKKEIMSGWKMFTYKDYIDSIDYDTTEYLKDIVNLKDSNPIKYYENLERRNRI